MAFSEQLKYRIAVKALQIPCFGHPSFFVQYQLNFGCQVILLQNDNHYDIRLKNKIMMLHTKIADGKNIKIAMLSMLFYTSNVFNFFFTFVKSVVL